MDISSPFALDVYKERQYRGSWVWWNVSRLQSTLSSNICYRTCFQVLSCLSILFKSKSNRSDCCCIDYLSTMTFSLMWSYSSFSNACLCFETAVCVVSLLAIQVSIFLTALESLENGFCLMFHSNFYVFLGLYLVYKAAVKTIACRHS